MYTLPRQPRCITRLCNHCTFIYIFCSRAPEMGRRDRCQGKTLILQEWSPWPQEDGLKRGRRQRGGHQDSIPNASTAHPEQTFGTEFQLETSKQRMTSQHQGMTSVGLGCKQRRLWFLLLMLMTMSLPQNCKEEIGKSNIRFSQTVQTGLFKSDSIFLTSMEKYALRQHLLIFPKINCNRLHFKILLQTPILICISRQHLVDLPHLCIRRTQNTNSTRDQTLDQH